MCVSDTKEEFSFVQSKNTETSLKGVRFCNNHRCIEKLNLNM